MGQQNALKLLIWFGWSVEFRRDSTIVQKSIYLELLNIFLRTNLMRNVIVWSLDRFVCIGCMIWELITGHVPYSGNVKHILRQHLQDSTVTPILEVLNRLRVG